MQTPEHGGRKTRSLRAVLCLSSVLFLAGCGGGLSEWGRPTDSTAVMDIRLLAINDLHGNLEPPQLSVMAAAADGSMHAVPAGGMAYLASVVAERRKAQPHVAVVSAGDMVGASPMVSSLFLDEPTIEALNLIGMDFSAVGNHEFDQGWQELVRLQQGGCEQFTTRVPCQINPDFAGANFAFLAGNTLRSDGQPLLAATGTKVFEQDGQRVRVGFIGLTLEATPTMVRPSGVQGLRFTPEAQAANAWAKQLRDQGADVVVLLIHEGGATRSGLQDDSCAGLSGGIMPILQSLSPLVDVVVSGHTHQAYLCDYARIDPSRPFLLTSAGRYGTLLTEIALTVDLRSRQLLRKTAQQHIVQGQAFVGSAGPVPLKPQFAQYPAEAQVQQLVARYSAAVAPLAAQPMGYLAAEASRGLSAAGESVLGRLVADAQLHATRSAAQGGAQLSLMNTGGLRADLVPDALGRLNYGQLYAVLPFGNTLMVKTLSGAQIHRLLEQQFASGSNTLDQPRVLQVSEGFSYAYARSAPPGQRVRQMMLHGQALVAEQSYRVAMHSYLGAGGDNFSVLAEGSAVTGGMLDLQALQTYVQQGSAPLPLALPLAPRIQRLD